jgi:hypothetical protein
VFEEAFRNHRFRPARSKQRGQAGHQVREQPEFNLSRTSRFSRGGAARQDASLAMMLRRDLQPAKLANANSNCQDQ